MIREISVLNDLLIVLNDNESTNKRLVRHHQTPGQSTRVQSDESTGADHRIYATVYAKDSSA